MRSAGYDTTQTRHYEYPVFKGHLLDNIHYGINTNEIDKHIKLFLNAISVTTTHKTHISADLVSYYDNPISMINKSV